MSKFGLGKGLGALIPEHQQYFETGHNPADTGSIISIIPLDRLKPNPEQPRKTFTDSSIEELAGSIRRHGLLQPIIAEATESGEYLIIAGERRYRAANLAGLAEVPVIVRPVSSEKRLELSLIENVQREDLNPMEEARAYHSLMELTDSTQEQVAEAVGKNRSTVANALRLLRLPDDMQEAVRSGMISAGHARSLLAVADPAARSSLFGRIANEGLSVRQAEMAAQELASPRDPSSRRGKGKKAASSGQEGGDCPLDPELRAMRDLLIEKFGTKVDIRGTLSRGQIAIEYYTADDLQRILDTLGMGG